MIWNWLSGSRNAENSTGSYQEVVSALRAQAKPCVLLREGDGNSRIGGLPDSLPNEWPTLNGTPLAFVAELDLSEIHRASGPDWLPSDGRLLFFYDAERQPWGFDPADRGGWSVIYQRASDSNPRSNPVAHLPKTAAFAEKRLSANAAQCLPDANSERTGIDLGGLTDEDFEKLYDAIAEHYGGLPAHQVGGFPNPIQGDDMELEAQLASNGLYCGNPSGYQDPRAKQLEAGAKDWVLLLQLDSDDDVDMMWGDVGRLYFWVREQDARRGDFSNVWLILQCS